MTPTTSSVSRWLLTVTQPVLAPLSTAIAFRHVEQLAGLALLAVGVGAVARLAAQLVSLPDVGTASWLPTTITGLLVTLVVISLVKGVSRYLEQFFGHLVAFKALELLRVALYRALVPQAPMVSHRSTSGDLLVRATKDIDRVEVFFAHTFPPAITAVTVPTIAVAGIGGWISWPVAIVLAVGLLVSAVGLPLLGARRSVVAAGRGAALRGLLGQHVTDSMQGMTEVVGYGHGESRLAEMGALDDEITAAEAPRGHWQTVRAGLQTVTTATTTLAVVLLGLSERLDLVQLTLVVALTWKLFDSTKPVSAFMASLDASLAAAQRVHEVVHAAPAVTDPPDPTPLPPGSLSVRWQSVTYRYPGSGPEREAAVEDVTIDVPAGSHCVLAGVSGSGKSTLLNLALRVDDATAGEVLVGGLDVRLLSLADLRARVALVSQTTFLLPGSIAANLRLAKPGASEEELWEVLTIAQLSDEVRAMPTALDTPVGEHGTQLSGGQRQRLALARCLLEDASIVLLDEFTSHLDPPLAARVRAGLRAARPGVTIIESAHDLHAVVDADQIVVLDRGRITPEALDRLLGG
ncbi:amino acid ABC transporter ATP-binding/permease protein [Salana multivorans]